MRRYSTFEIESKAEQEQYDLCGRRIMDINHFFNSLKTFNHCGLFSCTINNLNIINEKRIGLATVFFIKCNLCKETLKISSEADDTSKININKAAVLAMTSTGGGHAQLEEILGFLNVPCMSTKSYLKYQDEVASHIHETALASMYETGKEEARLAREAGDVDADDIPFITVVADGAWSKRSYKVNYDANSGVGVIVGHRTGKVLYLGIRNKYCCVCSRYKGLEPPEHACFKNWDKPSTGMEADIIVEGFCQSMAMHGLKYAYLVGDGDSSVSRKLLEARPYGRLLVHKIECRNHLFRNLCTRLRELTQKRISSNREFVSVQQRNLLKNSIKRLRCGIQSAVNYHRLSSKSHQEKIIALKKDILNCPNHVFGDHVQCCAYFCQRNTLDLNNHIPEFKKSGLYQDIVLSLNRLNQNADSLLLNMDNNIAENYNSIVVKFTGGKRINFSAKGSFNMRCEAAAISFNADAGQFPSIIHKSMTKNSPGKYTKKFIRRRECAAKWKKYQMELNPQKYRKTKTKIVPADSEYGPQAAEFPRELPTDYDDKATDFINTLSKSVEEIDLLQNNTRGQSFNSLWRNERGKRLTASFFGRICKMRRTTHCAKAVYSIVYDHFHGNSATKWGRDHESIAITEFQDIYGTNVLECGLFVDLNNPFLAASPDGLIAHDGIIEIKCPYSCSTLTPFDGIAQKKIKFATVKNGKLKLKTNHSYYYQVQGQLHVTNRQYCIFILWTPYGLEIEKILRDDTFWDQQMFVHLKEFYFKCLLPELIDSMYPLRKCTNDIRDLRKINK